jgi:hypothetical protein
MSDAPGTDLVPFDPTNSNYPVLFDSGEGGITEIIAENFGDEGFQTRDLERITIPAQGGKHWIVPDEAPSEVLEGIVVAKQKTRSYWVLDPDDPEHEEGAPPDCASADGILGNGLFGPGSEGNRSGECASCPMNAWGSGKGKGKACKEQMQLFMLREGSILPTQVTLAPTSLDGWRKYMLRLANKSLPFYGVVTRLGLAQDKGPVGPYSYAVPERGDILAPEERAAAKNYGELISAQVDAANRAREASRAAELAAQNGAPIDVHDANGTSTAETPATTAADAAREPEPTA